MTAHLSSVLLHVSAVGSWASDGLPGSLAPWKAVILGGLRVGSYLGFVLLVGTSIFLTWLWPEGRVVTVFRALLGLGTILTLVTAVVAIPVSTEQLGFGAFGGRLGALALARAALVLVGVAFLQDVLASSRSHRVAISMWQLGVIATYVLASDAWGGSWVAVKVLATSLHLLATAAWLGGLLSLASVLVPRQNLDALRTVLPRFSVVAIVSVITLVVSGILHALVIAGSLHALATTAYGQALLIKLAVFGAMLLLGNVGRRYAGRLGHRPVSSLDASAPEASITAFAVAVGAEFALAVGVLVATASLVHFAPGG